jgi:integrase
MGVYAKKKTSKGQKRWTVAIYFKGRRRDFTVKGSKADAEAFEARQRVELAEQGVDAMRVVPRLSDFCVAHYRPHAETRLRNTTWYKQKFLVAEIMAWLGNLKLDECGTVETGERYARIRRDCGLKPVSVNNELRVLRRIVNYARERGLPIPPPRFKMLPEGGGGRVRVWNDHEVAALMGACAEVSPSIVPLVVFLLNTGCRKGEALALTWDHVDLDRGMIRIWPSADWSPKNGKPREIPISKALMPFLTGSRASDKWVFPSSTGERYAAWPKLQFDRARAKAGLVGGPHTCRHTYASHFLMARPDLFLLAQVLGHSEIAVTRRYSHLLPDHLERARDAVNFPASAGPSALEAARRWNGRAVPR